MSEYEKVFEYLNQQAREVEEALMLENVQTRITLDDSPSGKDGCLGFLVALLKARVQFTISLWTEGEVFDAAFKTKVQLVIQKLKEVAKTTVAIDPTILRQMLVADFN